MWDKFLVIWGTTAGKKTITGAVVMAVGMITRAFPQLVGFIGVVDSTALTDWINLIGLLVMGIGITDAKVRARAENENTPPQA